MAQAWKSGRGKLGVFSPLIGTWRATSDTPRGPVTCERAFTLILSNTYVQLDAAWTFRAAKDETPRVFREHAIFGPGSDGIIAFWSFTSDGKRSEGRLAAASDIHPKALCFEAQMDAGLARQIYWPDAEAGVRWAVESRTRKGWNRFTEHHYKPV
jgi:hypothetical protein